MLLLVALMVSAALFAQRSPLLDRPAPALTGSQWLNTADGKPVDLTARRGLITVVHFWTFACINCRRNLPAYGRWHDRFAKDGVVIVGVHTPELEHEKSWPNVVAETKKLNIRYPVLFDPGYENWNRWKQQYWPTVYAIDRKGVIRGAWIGELNYGGENGEAKFAAMIAKLIEER